MAIALVTVKLPWLLKVNELHELENYCQKKVQYKYMHIERDI